MNLTATDLEAWTADASTMWAGAWRGIADFGSVDGYLHHLGMASVIPYLRANLLSL